MPYSLTWLPKVLKDAGCMVHEIEGWERHGHGNFGKPLGVMFHHTVGAKTGNFPSMHTVVYGRPGLKGPLCNLGLARDGTFMVVAAGCAWHAGKADRAPYRGVYSGNVNLIGIEVENTGYPTDPWPQKQLNAMALGCAAMLTHIHQPASQCIGHKEWAPSRKIDPHSLDMNKFRELVAAFMKKPSGTIRGTANRMMSLFSGPDPDCKEIDGCGCKLENFYTKFEQ